MCEGAREFKATPVALQLVPCYGFADAHCYGTRRCIHQCLELHCAPCPFCQSRSTKARGGRESRRPSQPASTREEFLRHNPWDEIARFLLIPSVRIMPATATSNLSCKPGNTEVEGCHCTALGCLSCSPASPACTAHDSPSSPWLSSLFRDGDFDKLMLADVGSTVCAREL